MSAAPILVETLSAQKAEALRPDLARILAACVAGGASISFMNPFGAGEADRWWTGVIETIEAGRTILFGAFDEGRIVGSVQLGLDTPPNQPHRADVRKLIVDPAARNRGAAFALMRALERDAAGRGLTLLVLDTVTGSPADRLYRRLGWTETGVIPGYALWPDGGFCDTTVFWKRL